MPHWFSLYLTAFVAYGAWTTVTAIRAGERGISTAAELISDVCLVITALAYWYSDLRLALGGWLIAFFVVGPATMVASTIPSYLQLRKAPHVSSITALQAPLFALAVGCILFSPILYFGFLVAVLGRHEV